LSKTWFTSDLHLFHKNIITYCNRPFTSIEEMHEKLIANWNLVVKDEDTIWILGDLSLRSSDKVAVILRQLKGYKNLVTGNHDLPVIKIRNEFVDICQYKELNYTIVENSQKIVLCHYPFATWNGAHRGSWCLHGHSHGSYKPGLPTTLDKGKILDVGVDVHNYFPISLAMVAAIMSKKSFHAVDAHRNGAADETA
jgi:calcineurin-like phosphoesterase family protein